MENREEEWPGLSLWQLVGALGKAMVGPRFGPIRPGYLRVFSGHMELDGEHIRLDSIQGLQFSRRHIEFRVGNKLLRLTISGFVSKGQPDWNLTRMLFELISALAAQDTCRVSHLKRMLRRIRMANWMLGGASLLPVFSQVWFLNHLYESVPEPPQHLFLLPGFLMMGCIALFISVHQAFLSRCARRAIKVN